MDDDLFGDGEFGRFLNGDPENYSSWMVTPESEVTTMAPERSMDELDFGSMISAGEDFGLRDFGMESQAPGLGSGP